MEFIEAAKVQCPTGIFENLTNFQKYSVWIPRPSGLRVVLFATIKYSKVVIGDRAR